MTITHLGEVARIIRKQQGQTLVEVGEAMLKLGANGCDSGNLSRFERGEQEYSQSNLQALARVLGTSLSAMYRTLETQAEIIDVKPRHTEIDRLLRDIGKAAQEPMSKIEKAALADGLRAQLAWLSVIREK